MTQRFYIKCPSCGHIYQIKMQMDQNVHLFDWPIVIECKECGDIIRGVYSRNGLSIKQLSHEQFTDHSIVTTMVGYSSSLPVVDSIYMKDGDGLDSMALFSPYMNLLGNFTSEELAKFDGFLVKLQKEVLPYREGMLGLLPMIKKNNIKAYCNKFTTLFGKKIELGNMGDVYAHYMSILYKNYLCLRTFHYSMNECRQYISPLFKFIDQTNLNNLKLSLNSAGIMSEWYKNEALPYIAKTIKYIEKLIPSMIYSVVGEYCINNRGILNITTISHEDAMVLYKDGYEVFVHGLPYIVGIRNVMDGGSVDDFCYKSASGIKTLADFAKLPGGLMENKLSDYQNIMGWIGNTMNNKVRNAASYDGVEYNSETQMLNCHYDQTDRNKVYKLQLIELCDMVYMQLLHIMEITILAYTIVTRINTKK